MKEYTVVYKHTLKRLIKEVKRLIKEGWMPQGGIFVEYSDVGSWGYAQAMVR